MFQSLIEKGKKIVPKGFTNDPLSIPWLDNNSRIIKYQETYKQLEQDQDRSIIPPTIFVDPDYELTKYDETLDKEVCERGTDALAWYVSFHQSKRWGIYIRTRGLSHLSKIFSTKRNTGDINSKIKRAFDVLLYHELFHFLTDLVSLNMEMIYKEPIHNPYCEIIQKNPTQKNLSRNLNIEESLANAYVLHRYDRRYHPRIAKFFKNQPYSYRQFSSYLSDYSFQEGKKKLGGIMRSHNFITYYAEMVDMNIEPLWEFYFNINPEKLYFPDIPIYLVNEKVPRQHSMKFITPVMYDTKIAAYVNDHPPKHIHLWIPADNKRDGRYLYPSLRPYLGSKPLNHKMKKRVNLLLDRFRGKIERDLAKISDKKIAK